MEFIEINSEDSSLLREIKRCIINARTDKVIYDEDRNSEWIEVVEEDKCLNNFIELLQKYFVEKTGVEYDSHKDKTEKHMKFYNEEIKHIPPVPIDSRTIVNKG